jgi:hypothetical protein
MSKVDAVLDIHPFAFTIRPPMGNGLPHSTSCRHVFGLQGTTQKDGNNPAHLTYS